MLKNAIAYFTREKHIMSCLSVTCGTAQTETHWSDGVIDLQGTPVVESTLYDLASLTKLFTGLTVLRLREEGLLDLSRPVTRYAPDFTRLHDVTVDQVLGFELGLQTSTRVDAQTSREAGLAVLRDISAMPHQGGRIYSDMHAMVLKYVIEGACGMRYFDCLQSKLLIPLGMTSTFAHVPQEARARCASCDREHRVERGRMILRTGISQGTPHDPKARLLSPEGNDLCGHAGLFASRGDMVRLCQGLLGGRVISGDSLRYMARNRTGHSLPQGGYTQYLGSQCYVKHPDQYYSEIPAYMSSEAIGLSGFTGHHLSVDPITGVFCLFLGDRVLDRLTVLTPAEGCSRESYGLASDGSGTVEWSDGRRVWSSVDYVHQKDARLHRPVAAYMGLEYPYRSGSAQP